MIDDIVENAQEVSKTKNQAVVFTRPNCPWCDKVEAVLKDRGFSVTKHNIYQFENDDLKAFALKYKTVPQVFIEGRHIGGHDDTVAYFVEKDRG